MGILNVKIERVTREGKTPPLPERQSEQAAAFDLRAFLSEAMVIPPQGRAAVPTGLKMAIPAGYCGYVLARSGLAFKRGVCLSNGVGLIDSDFRGEVMVSLLNTGQEAFTVQPGDRIAQFMLLPVLPVALTVCDALSETERGEGGFGSTGVF